MCAQAMCCRLVLIVLFLCSGFIMSQVSAVTITPPVTVVCCSASSLIMPVSRAPMLRWLSATSGQHDVVLHYHWY